MNNNELNELFLRIAEELDISSTLFDKAETSYLALGEYINNHCDCSVIIYTQGSFRLGTVIRPLNDEDEYDLDLVCEVASVSNISSMNLKKKIGDILRDSQRYSTKLEEKTRCWRIEYSDEAQFHIDITSAILENASTKSILITNKNDDGTYSYTISNPKGYSDWFEKRKRVAEIRQSGLREVASVEPIKITPNKIKLPLQQAIQILKRHRDIMFESRPEEKPISVIITTLAAQAYDGQTGVYNTTKTILENMLSHIIKVGEKYYVPNPTNPQENFADKWNHEPKKARAFFDWVKKASDVIITMAPFIIDDYSVLEQVLGETVIARAVSEIAPISHNSNLPTSEYNNPAIKKAFSVPYRQKPHFKVPKHQILGIQANVTENGIKRSYHNNGMAIPKNCGIEFALIVSPNLLKGNYSVIWQVVNTGEDAQSANCLRGGFETEVNSIKRNEGTQYRGTHYIQAFLLKRNKCIAMSREFIVNIQ